MKSIRVVDLTSVLSGPFCTWLLASMGADVIKVESPAGDLARSTPPFVEDTSLYFASLNRNKRSVVLDLKSDQGVDALRRLIETADVFVENMRPGVRDRLGFSDSALRDINPNLIVASISGFGQTGALSTRPAYDIVVQAMSGMMSVNGPMGGPATRVGFSVGDISAALFTTIGILQRLYERDTRGGDTPTPLDVSMLACQWVCLENAFARYLNAGIVAQPIGSRHPSMTPFEPYPTADRDIVIGLGSGKDWPAFCEAIGRDDLAGDNRFAADEVRLANRDTLDDILGTHFRQAPATHWLDILTDAGIPCSMIEDVESISNSPIAAEYDPFSTVHLPDHPSMRFVRSPIADPEPAERPAPDLGQHTREVLAELGFDAAAIERLAD